MTYQDEEFSSTDGEADLLGEEEAETEAEPGAEEEADDSEEEIE